MPPAGEISLHAAPPPSTDDGSTTFSGPWYKELNSYHWFVFVVAALGWLFDTMDQQLFTLARPLAMIDLIQMEPAEPPAANPGESEADHSQRLVTWEKQRTDELNAKRKEYGGYATSIFLIGWATGGLIFGVLGDRWGRVKTMLITIVVYSIFTGISAFSRNFWEFCFWRFLTGLGVGGEFAVGVSLVAEVMPSRARPHALGLLQATFCGWQYHGSVDRNGRNNLADDVPDRHCSSPAFSGRSPSPERA